MTEDSMDDIHAETQARHLLAAACDSIPGGSLADAELLSGVRRHARRRARTRAGVAAGSAAAVIGGTAAVFHAGTVPAATPALAAVTSAVTKTSAASFRVDLTVVDGDAPSGLASPSSPFHVTGEFDPAQGTGEETTSNRYETLFTSGHVYARWPGEPAGARPWNEQPSQEPWNEQPTSGATLAWDYNADNPIDPAELLSLLKSAGDIRDEGPASGPGWSGTKYGFTVQNPVKIVQSDRGTLSVDSDGHLRQLDQTVTFAPAAGQPVTPADVMKLDFTFSDFGIPVDVTAPPASQVAHPGVFWGIQF
jgi:hypothetical protein